METGFMNRITGLVIALVVGGLLVGGLLIPSIEGMTEPEKTIINKGANYALYELGETHTITFTADSMITDGVAQPLPDTSVYGAATVAYGAGGMIRYHTNGYLAWWGNVYGEGSNRSLGPAVNITLNIDENGTLLSDGASTNRGFTGTVMYANPAGNLALSYNPYVVEDSHIYGAGATDVAGVSYGVMWDGTVSEITVSPTYPPAQDFGEVTVNTTNPATNLLKITSVVIPDTTAGADFTYTYFFAPKEITYDNPLQLDATQIAMFGVISILGIVALVVVAANGIRNKY